MATNISSQRLGIEPVLGPVFTPQSLGSRGEVGWGENTLFTQLYMCLSLESGSHGLRKRERMITPGKTGVLLLEGKEWT